MRLSRGEAQATMLDWIFRWRYALHVLVYATAFGLSWVLPLDVSRQRVWLVVPEFVSEHLKVSLQDAILGITALAVLFAIMGAFLRTWGAAYLGSQVVADSLLQGDSIVAVGPYRFLRNPLYVGTFLHTLALCLILSWPGAIFASIAIGLLQVALIGSEESFLHRRFGAAYLAYCQAVPRIIPRFRSSLTKREARPRWIQAIVGEVYMWGTAVSFAVLGWGYNALVLTQAVVVSFGVSVVARGLMRKR